MKFLWLFMVSRVNIIFICVTTGEVHIPGTRNGGGEEGVGVGIWKLSMIWCCTFLTLSTPKYLFYFKSQYLIPLMFWFFLKKGTAFLTCSPFPPCSLWEHRASKLLKTAKCHDSVVITFLPINNDFPLNHTYMSITSVDEKNGVWQRYRAQRSWNLVIWYFLKP